MKVRSYGKLADLLGAEQAVDIHESCTVGDIRAHLAEAIPDAAIFLTNKRVRACVGDCLVPDSYVVRPGDCVDLLPPVSGG